MKSCGTWADKSSDVQSWTSVLTEEKAELKGYSIVLTINGVDCFGPFTKKIGREKDKKMVLSVYMGGEGGQTVRAVHVEAVP